MRVIRCLFTFLLASGVALAQPPAPAATRGLLPTDFYKEVTIEDVAMVDADHIIVADDDFVSLRHNGLLPERKGNGYGI